MPALLFDRVTFAWPDGTPVLDAVSGAFGAGRTGLVGRNGAGKTTLLRLATGELTPASGAVVATGEVAMLPQQLTLDTARGVADLLGVAEALAAVRAVESGDASPAHFEAIGDDWDVEARATAALAEAGLPAGALDRRIGELSGGETVLAALAGLRLRRAPITLLDEPTNNLDRDARERLSGMIAGWRGTLVVVSHDVTLLDLMDDTAELYEDGMTTFGGPYSAWRAWRESEDEAARQAERAAAQDVRRERRQRIEAETTIAHRRRAGAKASAEKRAPKIIMNARKRAAEVSAGRLRGEAQDKERAARERQDAARRRIRDDDTVRLDLPDPGVSSSRRLATFRDGDRSWVLQGPERIALTGPNGAGKTTLLERLVGLAAASGDGPTAEAATERIGYLRQRLDGLDEAASAVENVRAVTDIPEAELRNRLARLLLRGSTADRPVQELSGGERFRVALARLLLADPAPQLLVLDEPTNNLDLDTVDRLLEGLAAYRGGLVVVSHDEAFLARVGPALRLELRDGRLREPTS